MLTKCLRTLVFCSQCPLVTRACSLSNKCRAMFAHVFHSRPQRPGSFWSAPRIATSGRESRTSVVGHGQRSRFLVLTKRSAASGDENARFQAPLHLVSARHKCFAQLEVILYKATSLKFQCRGPGRSLKSP